jgi:hypothetical protein
VRAVTSWRLTVALLRGIAVLSTCICEKRGQFSPGARVLDRPHTRTVSGSGSTIWSSCVLVVVVRRVTSLLLLLLLALLSAIRGGTAVRLTGNKGGRSARDEGPALGLNELAPGLNPPDICVETASVDLLERTTRCMQASVGLRAGQAVGSLPLPVHVRACTALLTVA